MLAERVFELCEPELHLQYLRRESFTETDRLFSGPPVCEVCRGAGSVLDDDILNPLLQAARPGEQAFDACRIGCDHADRREAHAGLGHVIVHRLEPVGCDLAGTRAHVGKNDRRPAVEMIDKGIKACRGMNVDLGYVDRCSKVSFCILQPIV